MGARAQLREVQAEVEDLRAQVAEARAAALAAKAAPAARTAPPPPPAPRRPVRSATRRWGPQAKPLVALAVLEVAGAGAHSAGLGYWAITAGLATGAVWWLRRAWRLDRTAERTYAWACWLAACGWLADAGAHGATTVDTRLWLAGAGAAVPWWVHHRIRPKPAEDDTVTAADWTQELRALWDTRISCPNGPLPTSRLLELRQLDGGWEGVIEIHDGNADYAIARWKDIGARLRLRIDEIDIEPHPGGLHLARIIIRRGDNPLLETRTLLQPSFDPASGRSTIGFYSDDKPVTYRHYRRGSGPIHDLFSGSTRSGKTELVKTLLGEERRSGVIVSYLLDPQRGQSYGIWKKKVHKFAGTVEEILDRLRELERRMEGRSDLLSATVWRDEKGREREGIEDFTPGDPRHGLPMIAVTIDEFQRVVGDPVYGGECAELVERMIEMSAKCGIKFRLLTPLPLLDSIGGSQRIKDAVGSGNVVVFRTANQLTGQYAFNGVLPVDPCELPKEWPNGETTAGLGFIFGPGADRPTKMRTVILHDHYEWATAGAPAIEDNVIAEPKKSPVEAAETAVIDTPDIAGAPSPAEAFSVHTGLGAGDDDSAEDKQLAKDRVLAHFADGAERMPVDVKKHFHAAGIAPRTVGKALRDLTDEGLLEHPKERGPYWLSAAGRAELDRRAVA